MDAFIVFSAIIGINYLAWWLIKHDKI